MSNISDKMDSVSKHKHNSKTGSFLNSSSNDIYKVAFRINGIVNSSFNVAEV